MLAMKAKWDDTINYPDFVVEGIFDAQNAASSYSQWWNMSGSGSAFFVCCGTREEAEKVANTMRGADGTGIVEVLSVSSRTPAGICST